MMPWRTFVARLGMGGIVLTLAVFAGVRLATADPGGPASPDALTFAGVLRTPSGAPFVGMTALTFVFRKVGDGGVPIEVCRTTTDSFPVSDGGAFSVRVPMDPMRCPRSLFDGASVVYDVLQGTESLTPDGGVAVTPVPYARFADQAGVNSDCPAGYSRVEAAGVPWLCVRGNDQVVRVGRGASAFWIDRYEASVWSMIDAQGTPYFRGETDFPAANFPRNGQWPTLEPPAYAASAAGPPPARWVTWFQASEACRASGKRLPSAGEWLAAARGAPDPGASNGSGGRCNTQSGEPRNTGMGTACVSASGAQDMIGNVWEWTADWSANAGQITSAAQTIAGRPVTGIRVNNTLTPWPSGYSDDGTVNVTSTVFSANDAPANENVIGLPAAIIRGGGPGNGTSSGVFAFSVDFAPTHWNSGIGFRCVIPR